jgi:hypothetical protein
MSTSYSLTNAIKQAIISAFTAEQGTGRLATVQSVGPAWLNEAEVYPYIGVELIHRKEQIIGNQQRLSTARWGITVSVKSTTLLADAYASRDVLIDDGAGNGVEPILRDMAYNRLNGLISTGELIEVVLTSNLDTSKSDSPSEFFAEAAIIFETKQVISH